MPYLIFMIIAVMVVGLIALNVWYWRVRRKMTPEERKREDEEARIDMQPW